MGGLPSAWAELSAAGVPCTAAGAWWREHLAGTHTHSHSHTIATPIAILCVCTRWRRNLVGCVVPVECVPAVVTAARRVSPPQQLIRAVLFVQSDRVRVGLARALLSDVDLLLLSDTLDTLAPSESEAVMQVVSLPTSEAGAQGQRGGWVQVLARLVAESGLSELGAERSLPAALKKKKTASVPCSVRTLRETLTRRVLTGATLDKKPVLGEQLWRLAHAFRPGPLVRWSHAV